MNKNHKFDQDIFLMIHLFYLVLLLLLSYDNQYLLFSRGNPYKWRNLEFLQFYNLFPSKVWLHPFLIIQIDQLLV